MINDEDAFEEAVIQGNSWVDNANMANVAGLPFFSVDQAKKIFEADNLEGLSDPKEAFQIIYVTLNGIKQTQADGLESVVDAIPVDERYDGPDGAATWVRDGRDLVAIEVEDGRLIRRIYFNEAEMQRLDQIDEEEQEQEAVEE